MNNYLEIIEKIKNTYSKPLKHQNSILQLLHDEGFSMVESMRIVRQVCNISLEEAKNMMTNSPIWEQENKAGEALHNQLLQNL